MPSRTAYPAGVPCFIETAQPSLEAARGFYGELFGWELEERLPSYAIATRDGLDVAGIAIAPGAPAAWGTYIAVESADEATAAALQLGGTALEPPFDVPEAGRMSRIQDPTGAMFCTWEQRGFIGAQLVNAAGSWNWSDLYTPDPSMAEPFYRALFGWEASAVSFGGESSATMWKRPGYGDTLEAHDPGVRRRHEEAGAPEGFTDAIGWMIEDTGPSRWQVTLSVEDADASAAKVAELGGEVVVPPYDAGPVRVALVSDPQGAAFTISRYDPS
ncbi:MAG TPA: VOC family protein [Solirubrobacteraceae bacterium]|nr:VOC family protein [Solirubrobacteraceae bacterium]